MSMSDKDFTRVQSRSPQTVRWRDPWRHRHTWRGTGQTSLNGVLFHHFPFSITSKVCLQIPSRIPAPLASSPIQSTASESVKAASDVEDSSTPSPPPAEAGSTVLRFLLGIQGTMTHKQAKNKLQGWSDLSQQKFFKYTLKPELKNMPTTQFPHVFPAVHLFLTFPCQGERQNPHCWAFCLLLLLPATWYHQKHTRVPEEEAEKKLLQNCKRMGLLHWAEFKYNHLLYLCSTPFSITHEKMSQPIIEKVPSLGQFSSLYIVKSVLVNIFKT